MAPALKYEEEELIALLKNSDESAFAYLYDHYSGALYTVILRMTGDTQLSEDLLQESFIKIWNNISAYNPSRGRLFTWMLNIARNLTIDNFRSKSYKKQSKIHKIDNTVYYNRNSNNEINKFDTLGIRKQTLSLKEDQRVVLDLAYFEGFTQEEITKKLGIPLGTVKTRMRAAITELKKIFRSEH